METNIINKSVNIKFLEDVLGIQFFGRLIIEAYRCLTVNNKYEMTVTRGSSCY